MTKRPLAEHRESVRDDFAVDVRLQGDFVTVRARPLRRPGSPTTSRPALPSRSRLVVWAGRQGAIRDHLRSCGRWNRFLAALRRRRCLTHDEQIEELTDELLAAIVAFEPSSLEEWAEPGDRMVEPPDVAKELSRSDHAPARRSKTLGLFVAIAIVGVVTAGALTLVLAGSGSESASAGEQQAITVDMPDTLSEAPEDDDADAEEPPAPPASSTGNALPEASVAPPASVQTSEEEPVGDASDERATAALSLQLEEYVVEPGDTLRAIANRFDVGLDQLLAANDLDSDAVIVPGQVLRLP